MHTTIPAFIAKFADGTSAFEVPDLSFQPGLIYWISGPNGAGKTTFLNCLFAKIKVGYNTSLLDQDFGHYVFEYQRVWWNIALPKITRGASETKAKEIACELLNKFDLIIDPDRYASSLSGGEQHLVVILRMLLTNADVLLLDEPTTNLDVSKILEELTSKGKIVVIASHDRPPFQSSDLGVKFKETILHGSRPTGSAGNRNLLPDASLYGCTDFRSSGACSAKDRPIHKCHHS